MLHQVSAAIRPPLPLAQACRDWANIRAALAEPPRARQLQAQKLL